MAKIAKKLDVNYGSIRQGKSFTYSTYGLGQPGVAAVYCDSGLTARTERRVSHFGGRLIGGGCEQSLRILLDGTDPGSLKSSSSSLN